MKNLDHGTEYLWSKDKFSTRFDFMKELYRQYQLRNYGEEGEAGDFYVLDVSIYLNTVIKEYNNVYLIIEV